MSVQLTLPYVALDVSANRANHRPRSCCFRRESFLSRQFDCSVDLLYGISNVGWGGLTTVLLINAWRNNQHPHPMLYLSASICFALNMRVIIKTLHRPGNNVRPFYIGAYPINIGYGLYKGFSKLAEFAGDIIAQVKMVHQQLLIADLNND